MTGCAMIRQSETHLNQRGYVAATMSGTNLEADQGTVSCARWRAPAVRGLKIGRGGPDVFPRSTV